MGGLAVGIVTLVQATVPASEFALSSTLESLPGADIECERIVESGQQTIMPLVWIRSAGREEIEAALEEDPTVEDVKYISGADDEHLYAMRWTDQIHLLVHMFTNVQATVLNANAWDGLWHFRVLYPSRSHFSRSHEFANERGLTFDVVSIREMEGGRSGHFGLTDRQYRALGLAVERGYYDVPREVTLEELADELDVSHQALSETLRRGTGTLLRTMFFPDLVATTES